jgi:hypothetical protein
VLVGLPQLLSQPLHLPPQLAYHLAARVVVHRRLVCYVGSLGGVGKGGQVLVQEEVVRADAGDHEAVTVTTDRLLENRGQLRVTVGYVALLPLPFGPR